MTTQPTSVATRPSRSIRRVLRHVRTASRRLLALVAASAMTLAVTAGAAVAAGTTPQPVTSLDQVVSNLRLWLLGILAAVATLYLTIGGLRYITANGDPGEIEKAKQAFKSAALGYALALLAPLLVTIVAGWVHQ